MAAPCEPAKINRQACPEEVRSFFNAAHKTVLTLLGYSGSGYEDEAAMMAHITRLFDQADPGKTIVNIGATPDGIGAAYQIAKQKGFTTSGIVSSLAKETHMPLSPCVDIVFYVKDKTWGGLLEGTKTLSPTSTAMVGTTDQFVAVGGDSIARDEFMAAGRLGKPTQFIPADMSHALAREKAAKAGQPAPTDFRGALGVALAKP